MDSHHYLVEGLVRERLTDVDAAAARASLIAGAPVRATSVTAA